MRAQQLMDQSADKHAVAAGTDANPLVGNRVIAGADRIDRYDLDAARFQLAQRHLDRVRRVILGDAEEHEVLRAIPVRFAKLPERAAEGIQPRSRHIHRTETAVGGKIGRTELLSEPTGQGLALIAAGEERKLPWIGLADVAEPLRCEPKCFVPADRLELTRTTRADPLHRPREARWRIVLHDAGGTLAAQHALIHRMIAVAFYVADAAVLQMHLNAATAGTHVARCAFDIVAGGCRERNRRFGRTQASNPASDRIDVQAAAKTPQAVKLPPGMVRDNCLISRQHPHITSPFRRAPWQRCRCERLRPSPTPS